MTVASGRSPGAMDRARAALGSRDFRFLMGVRLASQFHVPHAEEFVRALLVADAPLSFDELLEAAPGCSVAELSGWLGNAVDEGLAREREQPDQFELTARGRRVFAAGRRRTETVPATRL